MSAQGAVEVAITAGAPDGGDVALAPPPSATGRRSPRRHRSVGIGYVLALVWIVFLVSVALLADVLPLRPYDEIVGRLAPRSGVGASWSELLGTDAIGRSMVSRLAYGARQTLVIGLVGTGGSLFFGTIVGIAAGYFRGRPEAVMNVLLDAMLSVPPLVLLLTVAAIGRRDVTTVVVGLVIVGTPTFARLARASTIRVRNLTFVSAARSLGAGTPRILGREILPMVLVNLVSFAFLYMGVVVVIEGTLSFLGLGVPPPSPSWGGMINDGRGFLATSPHLVFVPAACLVLTVTSLNTIGDRLQRRFDSRESALR